MDLTDVLSTLRRAVLDARDREHYATTHGDDVWALIYARRAEAYASARAAVLACGEVEARDAETYRQAQSAADWLDYAAATVDTYTQRTAYWVGARTLRDESADSLCSLYASIVSDAVADRWPLAAQKLREACAE